MGLRLEDLDVYKIAMEIGDIVWSIVIKWEYFEKKTLGAQLVNAADSIALNISGGYGRFHYKENKNFCYYSRGSAKETFTAVTKANSRKLITNDEFEILKVKFNSYFRLIYRYINSIGYSPDNNKERLSV